jgi:hypothetical protein
VCKNIRRDWSRRHQERNRHAICHSTTLALSWFLLPPTYHPCVPHTHNYLHVSLLPIPRAIARNPPIYSSGFSPIIPSIISLLFYRSSLPWFYLQNLEGKPRNIWENIPCPIDPGPLKIWSNFHSKFSFEFNEVNWNQIHWTKYSLEIQILAMDFKNILGLKS